MIAQPMQWAPSAWTVWALGASLYVYGFFQRMAPGVMVAELMRDLDVTAAVLGTLSAAYFYAYAAMQLPAGLLLDRYGTRRLLAGATAIAAAGGALFALAESAEGATVGRVLIGLGAGFGWVGALKIVADWFAPQRFARIAGLTLLLGLGGGLGAQVPLAAALEAFGWRATMLAASLVGLVLALAIARYSRDPPRAAAARGGSFGLLAGLARVVGSGQSWILASHNLTFNAAINGFTGLWGVPYLMTVYGVSRGAAAAIVTAIIAGWGAGAVGCGWLSDRLGTRRLPMIVGSGVAASCLGAVIYLPPLPIALACVLLFGFGMASGVMVITYAAVRELHPPQASGAAIGFINLFAVAGIAVLQTATGVVLDLAWDGALAGGARSYGPDAYRTALSIYPVLLAAGHVLAYGVRETYSQPHAPANSGRDP